ncbi:fimbria/pilus outer membrane usher protein [Usitatibacter palustris]|uniref:PapC-like C-terminal domain-containing protein n=1 Tax=Usitatibacter palustris TaxID=2732487 RepID=A0A6M4H674_9PROT|nr:fimbria/pilus outer membrane usher protein [Usitatibacter palustris]QJR14832.1 hypothetical protein DSM104440_01645 [Usitatibacter palustris]
MTVARLLAGLLALAVVAPVSHAQSPAPTVATATAPAGAYPSFVALRLNGEPAGDGVLVMRAGKEGASFALGTQDAKRLRLVLASRVPVVKLDDDEFLPLDGLAGLTYTFNETTQVLSIEAIAALFDSQEITVPQPALVKATRPGVGVFLTYDVISQKTDAPDVPTLTSGQVELGIFTPQGVFTQSAFGQVAGSQRLATRLDTTFTIDQPASLASWRIGDTVSRTATWSPFARFGGIQYGTNFATQPTLITYPLTSMAGQTALPSVVDVYVNNVLSSSINVPAGPFTLNDLPTMNGQGQMSLVVRDLLGREQVYMQALYGSTTLLKPGLSDWSVQAGALRDNYGIESSNYGTGFASGMWRRGLTDDLTIEVGGEVARELQAAGAGAAWVWGNLGQFYATAAISQYRPDPAPDRMAGHMYTLGWERRSTTFNFGANTRIASENFRRIADGDIPPARREVSAFGSYGIGQASVGASYVRIDRPREERLEFVQAQFSYSFREWGFLSMSAVKSRNGPQNDQFLVSYSLPFDFETTGSVSSSTTDAENGRRTENRATLQRNLPTGDGYGYRIDVSDQERALADLRYQTRFGLYSAELSRTGRYTSGRVGASGSLIYMDDELVAGRRVEEAFGLVQIPGFPNVRVYLDNQEVGRTNARGNLFVARLRPYQVNRLSIEQIDLPMSAEVMTLKLDATPYLKSGVVVRFPVKESLGGIARFVDESGHDMPAGSVATLLETNEQFPVADDGQAYLTGLSPSNRVRVTWGGRSCTITVPFKPGDDPQPLLGTFRCVLQR